MQALSRLHPLGLTEDWSDKLQGQVFTSVNQRVTHEHYSQAYPLPPSTPLRTAPPRLPMRNRRRLLHRPAALAAGALLAEDRREGSSILLLLDPTWKHESLCAKARPGAIFSVSPQNFLWGCQFAESSR